MPPLPHPPRPERRRALAWLLVAALLLAQTLGLAHRVLHPKGDGAWLAGHHDGADCRLYDHVAHGDALVAAPALPPAVAAPLPPARRTHVGIAARHAAHYSARAPPRG